MNKKPFTPFGGSRLQVLVVNAQGDVTRVSTRPSKDVVVKGALSNFFKLGQEGKYRVYHNQYSSNMLALNKHQHREASTRRFPATVHSSFTIKRPYYYTNRCGRD